MTKEQLLEKSLGDLREIAKLQGVKSITKYRKNELVDIIMNGGAKPQDADKAGTDDAEPAAADAQPKADPQAAQNEQIGRAHV